MRAGASAVLPADGETPGAPGVSGPARRVQGDPFAGTIPDAAREREPDAEHPRTSASLPPPATWPGTLRT